MKTLYNKIVNNFQPRISGFCFHKIYRTSFYLTRDNKISIDIFAVIYLYKYKWEKASNRLIGRATCSAISNVSLNSIPFAFFSRLWISRYTCIIVWVASHVRSEIEHQTLRAFISTKMNLNRVYLDA